MAILVLHNDQPSVDLLKKSADSSIVFSSTYIPNKWDCIIRWGNGKEPDMHQIELNRATALQRLYSRTQAARCLAVNRIPFRRLNPSSPQPRATIAYRVHIVDMVPISVSSPRDGKFRPVADYSSPRADRAIRLARRVLYCLGLHFGRVDLGYTDKKILRVLTVSAAPLVTKKLASLYMNALTVASNRRLSIRPIHADEVILGADPEFMMVSSSTKRVVFASDFFGRDGLIGYDNQSYLRDRRNHPIAEIRPRPTASPAQLVHRDEGSASAGRSEDGSYQHHLACWKPTLQGILNGRPHSLHWDPAYVSVGDCARQLPRYSMHAARKHRQGL